jgi:hypothetical protein
MLIKAAHAVWNFLIELAEARQAYYKKHGYNAWH